MSIYKLLQHLTLIALISVLSAPAFTQIETLDRERAEALLHDVASDVRKDYYDPKFHGLDWDAKVAETKARIDKSPSWDMAMAEIAALFDALNDSHTTFQPARTPLWADYGWQFQMFGDHCYVTHVRPNSDAATKVKPGDEVLTLDGFRPTRATLPKIEYAINVLSPQASLHIGLRERTGSTHPVETMAKIHEPRRVNELEHPYGFDEQYFQLGWQNQIHQMRPRFAELSPQVLVLKLPWFFFSPTTVKEIVDKANKHDTFIIDLRENPGGAEETLQYLVGSMFDHDVKIADSVMRTKTKPLFSKTSHSIFRGKLIVLVDSGSSSASELFARTIQLEKRGMILGDHTSGLVMAARFHPHETGVPPVRFGANITEADLVMTDGKSLEHTGVTPDELVLPTPDDLAEDRDPVLARAAELAGVKLTPSDAGKLFPYEWMPQ